MASALNDRYELLETIPAVVGDFVVLGGFKVCCACSGAPPEGPATAAVIGPATTAE